LGWAVRQDQGALLPQVHAAEEGLEAGVGAEAVKLGTYYFLDRLSHPQYNRPKNEVLMHANTRTSSRQAQLFRKCK
ncbi:MAG: hypothetical protein V3W37_10335, partial [Candidatus Binatia bacterium]